MGQDVFSFNITKTRVLPGGAQELDEFPKACNRNDCFGNCEGCAGWVLVNENLDYLHCDDLSWDGETKCD